MKRINEDALAPPDVSPVKNWIEGWEKSVRTAEIKASFSKVNPVSADFWLPVIRSTSWMSLPSMAIAWLLIQAGVITRLGLSLGDGFMQLFITMGAVALMLSITRHIVAWSRASKNYRQIKKDWKDQEEEAQRGRLLLQATHEYNLRLRYLSESVELMSPEEYERRRRELLRKKRALSVVLEDLKGRSGSITPREEALDMIAGTVEEGFQVRDAMQELDEFLDGEDVPPEIITLPTTEGFTETASKKEEVEKVVTKN